MPSPNANLQSTNRLLPSGKTIRQDPPDLPPMSVWNALSCTPGIGVSITDAEGRLLFVNDTAMQLFSQELEVEYRGKHIADFHPPDFVQERLGMIAQVLNSQHPLALSHIYHGQRIASTVWPILDSRPPHNRVIVISRLITGKECVQVENQEIGKINTKFIDLGPLSVLTRRELEVLILLGQGINVPRTATILHRSPKTIQRHKAAISEKLNLRGHAELVALVSSLGLQLSDAHLKRLPRKLSPLKRT
ncbi:PAS and helix-turn-helix domain-containing protein [Aureliella helgolandensis]|uniref:Bacterial regulatory protein, luxR family n=1 Tax=Aureliella helgolandensis TaxID=2527968 RepID=A0A518FZW6_9BACT|nr:PAS and helix-turn-helix domain-containing protein [Aureliella helgolandensis]QDV21881.1 Bacterial regulatory protein, luxR family [Aureliella helgolandensis]